MKLKKIASLMLAGVMAVSMLAGCSNNGGNNNGSSSSEPTTTVGAADAMNAAQDIIEFKDGTSSKLASAVEKAVYSQLKDATVATTMTPKAAGDKVYDQLLKDLAVEDGLTKAVYNFTPSKKDTTTTKTYLYLVDDTVSEEVALSFVAKSLTATAGNYPDYVVDTQKYEAGYTGEVSIQKVTKSDGDTKTASAYYILVSVTQTVGNTALVGA